MTESNTRRWWRARIKAIMLDAIGPAKIFDMSEVDRKVEGWLDDFMETPELSLAEVADSNPSYRLVVVDKTPFDPLKHFGELGRVIQEVKL